MDPNLKVISRSITNLMLVGVLLSLVGGLVLLARPLAGEPLKLDLVSAWSSAFCLLGIFILCLRYGVILDRQQRTSTRWRGLLVPFLKGGEQRYSKAGYVSISSLRTLDPSKVTPLDRAFGTLVPFSDGCAVWLEEPGGAATLLRDTQDHDAARRFAEEIAKFLNLGLRDRLSTVEVIREAGKLDEPLRERLRRAGQSVPLPSQIEDARAIFSDGGTGATTSIDLPPAGISARSLLKAVLSAGTVMLVGMMGLAKAKSSLGTGALLYLLLAMFLLGLVLAARLLLRAATYREQVVISRSGITIFQHQATGTRTIQLTSDEIEEILLIPLSYPRSFHDCMSRVVIRGDRGSVDLGATLLQAAEVQWLRDVLLHFLGPANPETGAV